MKADPKAEAAPPNSKKKLMIMLIAGALVLVGGGAAWYFIGDKSDAPSHKVAKAAESAPPVFLPLDSFTVNLQPEAGEQYLQIQFTLQVSNTEQMEVLKVHMPKVRSRLLLLLSAKRASELGSAEGKDQLSKEIIASVNEPFVPKGAPQEVSEVLYTSFIIQ